MSFRSALYVGSVMHRRLRPRQHRLRYRLFWMLIDLDELDRLGKELRLFSRNRFNLLSFHDTDHGEGTAAPLRQQIERRLEADGIGHATARIELFCMPRICGYAFNPLSVYFCRDREGALHAVVYEVHNTFGERHSYVFETGGDAGQVLTQQTAKTFHVSPFLGMAMDYGFRLSPPGERISVAVHGQDADGPVIMAGLMATRSALNDRALLRLLAAFPLMTLKVIGAIHLHALRMFLKGFRIHPHPGRLASMPRASTSD
jgi:DUF1365 family protein